MPDQTDPHEKDPGGDGVSRRTFLKGAGLTAAGAAAAEAALLGAGLAAGGPKTLGPGAVPIVLKVNGAERRIEVEPRTTLADALRTNLALTGTKIVCDRGACSSCTVLVDGLPVNSCMTFALDVGAREITTIEGLAKGDVLHAVQAGFIAADAMQCGFCTSGMVMSCAALVQRKPYPTREEVTEAISGNLCRCGTYPHVVDALVHTAESGGEKGA